MVTVLFADLVDSTGVAQRPTRNGRARCWAASSMPPAMAAPARGHPEKFIGDAVMAVLDCPRSTRTTRCRQCGPASRSATGCIGCRSRSGWTNRLRSRRGGDRRGRGRRRPRRTAPGHGFGGQRGGGCRRRRIREVLVGATRRADQGRPLVRPPTRGAGQGLRRRVARVSVEALTTRSARRTIPFVGRGNELDILRGTVARVKATKRRDPRLDPG